MKRKPYDETARKSFSRCKRAYKNPRAVLVDAAKIRRQSERGMSQKAIATKHGVCKTTVGNILRGSHWSVRGEFPKAEVAVERNVFGEPIE